MIFYVEFNYLVKQEKILANLEPFFAATYPLHFCSRAIIASYH